MVTINDVAKKANVSASTVSRVISDSSRISNATKKKVREAMEELGYYPNAIARSLARKMTNTISIFFPRSVEDVFLNPFTSEVIRGISAITCEKKYDLLISIARRNEESDILRSIVHGRKADGIISLSSKINDQSIEFLKNEDIPFVVVGRPLGYENSINWVDNNNVEAAYDATRHLIEAGHRKIGFIGGSHDYVVNLDRYEGYKMALEEAGIKANEKYIIKTDLLEEGGYEGANCLMRLPEPPTAVVATDDLIAFGVMRAARDRGLTIREDLAVIGFNNMPFSQYASPPLSSVDINTYQLGRKASEMLMQDLFEENKTFKRCIIPHKLIVRRSTVR